MSDEARRGQVTVLGPKAAYLSGLADYEGLVQKKERRTKGSRLAILKGATEAFASRGFCLLKVGEIHPYSGFSRQTFNTEFKTKEACFEAAVAAAGSRLWDRVEGSVERSDGRAAALERAASAVVEFLVDDPDGAKLLVVEASVGASAGLVACREEFPKVWRRLAADLGCEWLGAEGCAAVGAIEALLAARLRGDEAAVAAVLVPMIAEHLERAMTSPGRSEQGREGGGGRAF